MVWAYLRIRVRQLEAGVGHVRDFSLQALSLAESDISDYHLNKLIGLNRAMGSGYLVNRLLRQMFSGELNTPITREMVAEQREKWVGVSRDLRLKYTQTMVTGLLADSYNSRLRGTLFRRAFFYVSATPADMSESLDAFETRVLLLGTDEAVVSRNAKLDQRHEDFARA